MATNLSDKKVNEEFSDLFRKAQSGDAEAQYNIGLKYYSGDGILQNSKKATKWYRMAALQGLAAAQCEFANMLRNGIGTQKNAKSAAEWYKKAAEQGHATAQSCFGLMLANGEGIEEDKKQAVEWYRKAVAQGNAYGQCNLGVMHYYSYGGVEKNFLKALQLFQRAAAQGDAAAEFNIGKIYEEGEFVPKDKKFAIECYKKAAEKGHDGAKDAMKRLLSTNSNKTSSSIRSPVIALPSYILTTPLITTSLTNLVPQLPLTQPPPTAESHTVKQLVADLQKKMNQLEETTRTQEILIKNQKVEIEASKSIILLLTEKIAKLEVVSNPTTKLSSKDSTISAPTSSISEVPIASIKSGTPKISYLCKRCRNNSREN